MGTFIRAHVPPTRLDALAIPDHQPAPSLDGLNMGFLRTVAVHTVACPYCQARPGEKCRTPKGMAFFPPHLPRIRQLLWDQPDLYVEAKMGGRR